MKLLDFLRKDSGDDAVKRVTITVPETTNDALDAIASDWDMSKSQTTKVLISRGMAMEALTQAGGEIVYRKPNGEEVTLYRQAIKSIDEPISVLDGTISSSDLSLPEKNGEADHSLFPELGSGDDSSVL